MAFNQGEVEQLLADTGRRCCICGGLHNVQVHHVVPKEQGGDDDIDNAIPLCPNCHDEIHGRYASGRTTRSYTPTELKLHRQRTIELVKREKGWAAGTAGWQDDKDQILFFGQCLDRPAFRTHFDVETSFSAFDRAMEDTLIALNTGYWRMRDGTLIERRKGKACVVNSKWRENLERIVTIVEEIRQRFRKATGFNRMLDDLQRPGWRHRRDPFEYEMMLDRTFRGDSELGRWMDEKRQEAIEIMNSMLRELGHQELQGIQSRW